MVGGLRGDCFSEVAAVRKNVVVRNLCDRQIGPHLEEDERLFYAFAVKLQGTAPRLVPLTLEPPVSGVLAQTPPANPFAGDQFVEPIQ
jgi:hypothetical protein